MSYGDYDALKERSENVIGRELARLRSLRGLSQPALCRRLEGCGVKVQAAAISKWEKGENIPHAYQLLALCHALGVESVLDTFQAEPALNGKGLERLSDYRGDLIASGRYRPERTAPEVLQYIDMPVSLLAVSAGTGNILDGDCCETVSFPANSVPKGAECGIRVSGDSMEPVYHDGQIVWVQRCASLRPGEVGVFFYDGSGYLKAYSEQEQTGEGRQPVLLSYNRAYAPIPVCLSAGFRILGKVLN